jgi:hypothetical protein
MVEMRHPKLKDRVIRVPEKGVFHRERAGWERVKPESKADRKANE